MLVVHAEPARGPRAGGRGRGRAPPRLVTSRALEVRHGDGGSGPGSPAVRPRALARLGKPSTSLTVREDLRANPGSLSLVPRVSALAVARRPPRRSGPPGALRARARAGRRASDARDSVCLRGAAREVVSVRGRHGHAGRNLEVLLARAPGALPPKLPPAGDSNLTSSVRIPDSSQILK